MKAPTLLIEEIEGNILSNNKLIMNTSGLINGERMKHDGIAFFGTVKRKVLINIKEYIQDNKIINDYILNIEKSGTEYGDIVFVIFYKKGII